jgi:hypothetical protein
MVENSWKMWTSTGTSMHKKIIKKFYYHIFEDKRPLR